MIILKKLFLTMAVALIMTTVFYSNVYANVDIDNNDMFAQIFQITGGLGEEGTELIVTFDTHRTITGVADEGTVINIQVFNEIYDELIKIINYENIVGASRVFSQDIILDVADNIIRVIVVEDDVEIILKTIVIRRICLEIKHEIEGQGIVLPGQSRILPGRSIA